MPRIATGTRNDEANIKDVNNNILNVHVSLLDDDEMLIRTLSEELKETGAIQIFVTRVEEIIGKYSPYFVGDMEALECS